MSLSGEEIGILLEELSGPLEGARVVGVRQCDAHTVVLALRPLRGGKRFLLFSTRPRLGRFHLVRERPDAPPGALPFTEAARKHLKGARLQRARQIQGDRVVEFAFAAPRASLVLEIRGGRGQLALVGHERRLLASLHPLRRGGKEIPQGGVYRFPELHPPSSTLKAATPGAWRLREGERPLLDDDPDGFPLHRRIEEHYGRLEEAEVLRERKESLAARLRREIRKRARALEGARSDLEKASEGEAFRRQGELLKGSFHLLRRGMDSVELEDYFDPQRGRIRVALDPALTPAQNVERCFKRYRKSKRALPVAAERVQTLETDLALAEGLVEAVGRAETADALQTVGEKALSLLPRPRAPVARAGVLPAGSAGPRRFLASGGQEILVGRNARGNDELLLRIARGNDVFLHVSGRPGAHVVVRTQRGKSIPLETLLDAAQLALYYSLPERSRKAGDGPVADVDYTPVKHVRKPKGFPPGKVLLATHKTLRTRLDAARLEDIRKRTGEGRGASV